MVHKQICGAFFGSPPFTVHQSAQVRQAATSILTRGDLQFVSAGEVTNSGIKNTKYNFSFPDDKNAKFDSISKYFPGNTSAYQYKDTNGVRTVDYKGNSIPHPYGIRIFGYNGGDTNIATLLFSSKSEWESWWNYMRVPQKAGNCKY